MTPVNKPRDIGATEAYRLLQGGQAVLVDVRDPAEFAAERVDGALNLPLAEVTTARLAELADDKVMILMCKSGLRSHKACDTLEPLADARLLAGGLAYWAVAGLPVWRAKTSRWHRLPLERRVQLVVGSLLVLLSLLALVVSPWFVAGCLFIGGGLLNAGLTGWCGMAKFLARL